MGISRLAVPAPSALRLVCAARQLAPADLVRAGTTVLFHFVGGGRVCLRGRHAIRCGSCTGGHSVHGLYAVYPVSRP